MDEIIPTKESTLIAENIVKDWRKTALDENDVSLVLMIAVELDKRLEHCAKIADQIAESNIDLQFSDERSIGFHEAALTISKRIRK